MPTLRQFRYFDALARVQHFGLAAERCAVTQPALSMQIQELEKELGVELIERRHKNVQLTPAGEEVAQRVTRILAEVRDLDEFARRRAAPLSGPLKLGVIPSIAPYLLPPLLPLIRERHPLLELHIRETQTRTLLDELTAGSLDLLLLALPAGQADVETMPLFEDRFVLAVPSERQIKPKMKATPELIEKDRLLLLEEGHCLRDQALAFCQLRQSSTIDTFGASSLSTIVQMVSHGLGLTLLPEICLPVEARNEAIALMRFAEPEPHRVVGLAWRTTSPCKIEFAALGELIAEAVPENRRIAREPRSSP